MKRARSAPADPDSQKAAYLLALRWLTARELSAARVRTRLAERGYSNSATDSAVQRLIAERAIDDRRAAKAVARTEAKVRRHGPRRVMGKLISLGFDRDLGRDIVGELFGEEGEEELLERALDKRLRGKPERLKDARERRKILGYLVRQGFSPSAVAALLRQRAKS